MNAEGTVAEVLAGTARFAVVCGDAEDVWPTIAADADVARLLWASVEAVEAAFALWSRARRVIERCGRAEARR